MSNFNATYTFTNVATREHFNNYHKEQLWGLLNPDISLITVQGFYEHIQGQGIKVKNYDQAMGCIELEITCPDGVSTLSYSGVNLL